MSNLFWVTGLSGSGKTTFAKKLLERLNSTDKKTILLDGDVMREIFENDLDYSLQARLKTAHQYSRLASFLIKNDVNVICSTISLFHEIQEWNRKNIHGYIEIFVKVDLEELVKRDSKKIYSQAKSGKLKNVVGVDITPEFPKNPDIILDNILETDLEDYVTKVLKLGTLG